MPLDPGSPFPSLALRDETGRPAAPPSGEVLYAFFKTTCPTSEFAWPYLDRVRMIGEGGRLALLAVSQDDPATTARFYERLNVAIPTLYDSDPWRASEAAGLISVPTFILVRGDGIVRDVAVGFQRHKMEEFAKIAASGFA